jgi:Uma2 family endonuclease
MAMATAAEPAQLPGDEWYEIEDGESLVGPAPTREHQWISMHLSDFLMRAHRAGHGNPYHGPIEVRFPDGYKTGPDLVFVRTGREAIEAHEGIAGTPDLIIEILSLSTAYRDIGEKRRLYEEHGVPHYWMVIPVDRAIQPYELAGGRYEVRPLLRPGDRLVLPFAPEIAIDDIGSLFPPA